MSRRDWLFLFALVTCGLALRAIHLDSEPLGVDEAESSINALTILDHGYPTDHYLGQPVFENTLVTPWPDHPEYEFRDISYANGMAIYHSWLPLYAIAGSLAVFGIEPDPRPEPLKVQHGPGDLRVRTIAPRVPAILFSAVFLLAFFALGYTVYGRDAAWTALLAAVLIDGVVSHGRQARYYSATYAAVTCAALAIWGFVSHRTWRHLALCAVALLILFYTHVLSCVIMGALLLVFSIRWFSTPTGLRQMIALGVCLSIGTLPWALYSGFLPAALQLPKAWAILELPYDLLAFPLRRPAFFAPAMLGLLWLGIGLAFRRPLPRRLVDPFVEHRRGFFFLATWSALGFFLFLALIPAASYFPTRPNIVTFVPGLLLFASVLASASRTLTSRYRLPLSLGLMTLTLLATGEVTLRHLRPSPTAGAPIELVKIMQEWEFAPKTRIYSTPNDHLVLTYYSGLPVQSIAPIRKSFLDTYQGPLFLIDTKTGALFLPVDETIEIAAEAGVDLSEEEAQRLLDELNLALATEQIENRTASHWPPKRELNALERRIAAEQAEHMRTEFRSGFRAAPILRGYDVRDSTDWWAVFKYRFSGVESRWREHLNYSERMRSATALVLPWGWTLYDSGPEGSPVVLVEPTRQRAYEAADAWMRSKGES